MYPKPVRIFTTYGLTADNRRGEYWFGAHPVTRLVFTLPAGQHTLRTVLKFSTGAYRWNLPEQELTDGVDVTLSRLAPDGTAEPLQALFLDPVHVPDDRAARPQTLHHRRVAGLQRSTRRLATIGTHAAGSTILSLTVCSASSQRAIAGFGGITRARAARRSRRSASRRARARRRPPGSASSVSACRSR